MARGVLGHGAGRLRPPSPPAHFATVYQLAHVRRARLARMATAGWYTTAYTAGAPRHRLRRAWQAMESYAHPNPDRLVEGAT